MSTSYYFLRPPITCLRVETTSAHAHISIWTSCGYSGKLMLIPEDRPAFMRMLSERDSGHAGAAIRTHFGGRERGCVVTEQARGLGPDVVLVDDYGDLFTVAEIREMDGKGKSDEHQLRDYYEQA